jgi:hypothetical protein
MKRFLVHSAAAILAVSTARADIIPEFPKGYRAAHVDVVFEGLESFPDTAFVLYPAYLTGPDGKGWSLVKSGERPRFYGLLGPKLYAVKRGTNPAFDSAFFPKPGSTPPKNPLVLDEKLTAQLLAMPHSEKGFSKGYVKVRNSSPINSVQEVHRITGINKDRITIERSERQLDASGKVIKAASRSWLKSLFSTNSNSAPSTDEAPQPSWQRTPIALATGTLAALSVLGLIRAKRRQTQAR